MEYEVNGSRPRGRPMRTWREVVQKDCRACKLNREDAMHHSKSQCFPCIFCKCSDVPNNMTYENCKTHLAKTKMICKSGH